MGQWEEGRAGRWTGCTASDAPDRGEGGRPDRCWISLLRRVGPRRQKGMKRGWQAETTAIPCSSWGISTPGENGLRGARISTGMLGRLVSKTTRLPIVPPVVPAVGRRRVIRHAPLADGLSPLPRSTEAIEVRHSHELVVPPFVQSCYSAIARVASTRQTLVLDDGEASGPPVA